MDKIIDAEMLGKIMLEVMNSPEIISRMQEISCLRARIAEAEIERTRLLKLARKQLRAIDRKMRDV